MTSRPVPAVTPPTPAPEAAEFALPTVEGEPRAVLPADAQLRTLRLLDAEAAAAAPGDVEPAGDAASDVDPLLLEAEFWLAELVAGEDQILIDVASAAGEHSRAAPPPLTEPGDVIDLLSGTEALEAIEALAPFALPEDVAGDSSLTVASPRVLHAESADVSHADLIFLDFVSFAKPESPGNGKGNGGGGDDGDGGTISSYLSGDANVADSAEYNIQITFEGSWTVELQSAFIWAADWISDVILGDVQDVFFRGKIIDDISITAELTAIDGTGGILGQAGPTAIRTNGYLPAAGKMEFDIADADYYDSLGLWDDIVLHEMLHTVGFGTIWDYLELVSGSGTTTPTFNGEQAVLAYADLFGGVGNVPLEYGWGSGTDESHWDEETFYNEIMTGFINGSNYVSGMTVASLTDLGYNTIDWSTEFSTATV